MKRRNRKIRIADLVQRAREASFILASYIGAKENGMLKTDATVNDTVNERINLLKQYHHAE